MRQQQMNWIWLVEPEDSCNAEVYRKRSPHTEKNQNSFLSIAKCLLWFGAAIVISLIIAGLH